MSNHFESDERRFVVLQNEEAFRGTDLRPAGLATTTA